MSLRSELLRLTPSLLVIILENSGTRHLSIYWSSLSCYTRHPRSTLNFLFEGYTPGEAVTQWLRRELWLGDTLTDPMLIIPQQP